MRNAMLTPCRRTLRRILTGCRIQDTEYWKAGLQDTLGLGQVHFRHSASPLKLPD